MAEQIDGAISFHVRPPKLISECILLDTNPYSTIPQQWDNQLRGL